MKISLVSCDYEFQNKMLSFSLPPKRAQAPGRLDY